MKKIIFSILFVGTLLSGYSTAKAEYAHGRTLNLINADNRLYHFGFILGLNAMDFNVTNSGAVSDSTGEFASADSEKGEIWYGEDTRRLDLFCFLKQICTLTLFQICI